MIEIDIAILTREGAIQALAQNGILNDCPEKVRIRFRPSPLLRVDGISFLALWGQAQTARGVEILVEGDKRSLDYLSRMDLFSFLRFEYKEKFNRHSPDGRFIPILKVGDPETCHKAIDEICNLVERQFENYRLFLPALEWCVNEITDNVIQHARAPGLVCAQYFPQKKELHISIADRGVGIKKSLSQSQVLSSDQDALHRALQKGVTRDKNVGMGNGLAGALEILKLNEGTFYFGSGAAQLKISPKKTDEKQFSPVPGTAIMMLFKTKNSVNLEDTFIGDSGYSFLDRPTNQGPL